MHQFVFVQWSDPSRACLLHLFSAGREGGAQAPPFSEPLWRQVEQIPSFTITRTRKFASYCPCCLLPITGRFYRNTLSVPNPRNLLTVHRKLATPLPLSEQTSFVDRPEEMLPLFEFPCLVTARQTDLPMSHICYLFSPIFKRAKILTWLSYKIPQI